MVSHAIKKEVEPREEPHTDNNAINGYAKINYFGESGSFFDKINEPDDFTETEDPVNGADHGENATGKTLEYYDQYRVTIEKEVPKTEIIAWVGDSPIAASSMVSTMTAEGKGGKTALKGAMSAMGLSDDGTCEDFEGMSVAVNKNAFAILGIDTEQSEDDQQYNIKQTLKRAGLRKTPDFFREYNIRALDFSQFRQFTSDIFSLCYQRFGGIHLAFIDGAADYISSVNDEQEANNIISFFVSLAVQYHCAIILIIHLNEGASMKGDTLPRGHIGKQGVRKGYAQLHISKVGDISTLQILRARKAGADTPLINYRYCKEKGYHVTVEGEPKKDAEAKKIEADAAKRARLSELAKNVLPAPTAIRNTDLVQKLVNDHKFSDSTADRAIRQMKLYGIIELGNDKLYRIILK